MKEQNQLIDEILLDGQDDWIGIWEIASVARISGGASSDREIMAVSMDLIRHLLLEGLMEAGDPELSTGRVETPVPGGVTTTTPGRFVPWPLNPVECVERIYREWQRLDRPPRLGEIGWLNLKAVGQTQGSRKV